MLYGDVYRIRPILILKENKVQATAPSFGIANATRFALLEKLLTAHNYSSIRLLDSPITLHR